MKKLKKIHPFIWIIIVASTMVVVAVIAYQYGNIAIRYGTGLSLLGMLYLGNKYFIPWITREKKKPAQT